jgi:outer membrane protein W
MESKNPLLRRARNALRRCGIPDAVLVSATLVTAGIVLAPSIAQAQEDRGDYDWKLFVGPSYVSPLSDSDISNVGNSIEASSELGYEIGIEWKGTDRLGFEISYLDVDTDLETSLGTIGDISMRPWMLSLNFHVIDKNAFNWYVGPTLAYVGWSDLKLSNGTRYDVDGESTFGVSTGFVVGLGETFGIQFALRYLDASIDAGLVDEISVDPLFAGVAVAFRF